MARPGSWRFACNRAVFRGDTKGYLLIFWMEMAFAGWQINQEIEMKKLGQLK